MPNADVTFSGPNVPVTLTFDDIDYSLVGDGPHPNIVLGDLSYDQLLELFQDGADTGTVEIDGEANSPFVDEYLALLGGSDPYYVEFEFVGPCYCPGTLIQAERGEVPVEALIIGDTVITASGQRRLVRWIGHRSHAGRFLAANPQVQPVLFRAGSLGDSLPRRNLWVSPKHAMFVDGVLVSAKLLVNGTTIVQERSLKQVDYYHVELDSHDVLLAEGAPSESFVDDDSRGTFHNAAEWERLYPGRERVPAVFCAPRVDSGPELEAIRRRLDVVAGEVVQAA